MNKRQHKKALKKFLSLTGLKILYAVSLDFGVFNGDNSKLTNRLKRQYKQEKRFLVKSKQAKIIYKKIITKL